MTPYNDIFKRFKRLIADFDLDEIAPENRKEILIDYLNNACDSWYPLPENIDLSRSDDAEQFNYTLDANIQAVLAYGMAREWLTPYLYNQDLIETNFSTKEYTSYSDANRITTMRMLYKEADKRMQLLSTKISVKKITGRLK